MVSLKQNHFRAVSLTANLKWPELKGCGYGNPSLCCRVFRRKLTIFLRELKVGKMPGFAHINISLSQGWIVVVIEFQLRGVPHAHCLMWDPKMTGSIGDKIKRVDEVLRSEVTACKGKPGRDIVQRFMQHHCFTAEDVKKRGGGKVCKIPCSYAKHEDCKTTRVDEGGRITLKCVGEENWRTVPFIERFLERMDCHVAVLACGTSDVIGYLLEYNFKGVDRTTFYEVRERTGDPGEAHRAARYLSAAEAFWAAANFGTVDMAPAVHYLQLSLRVDRPVVYNRRNAATAQERNTLPPVLMWMYRPKKYRGRTLRAYFETLGASPDPPKTATDIVRDNRPGRRWAVYPRPQGRQIFRFDAIPPSRGELFYFWVLLSKGANVRQCRLRSHETWEDGLRKLRGGEATFADAVKKFLPEHYEEDGAKLYMMSLISARWSPRRLRWAFCNCCCFLGWTADNLASVRSELIADLLSAPDPDTALLRELSPSFRALGRSLEDFGFSAPDGVDLTSNNDESDELSRIRRAPRVKLNKQQRRVVRTLKKVRKQDHKQARVVVIDAKGGVGKTFTMNEYSRQLVVKGRKPLVMASTGIFFQCGCDIFFSVVLSMWFCRCGVHFVLLALYFWAEKFTSKPCCL